MTVGEAALAGLTAEYQCAKLLVQYKIATLGAVAAVSASEPDPAAAVVATPAAAPGKLASLKSLFGFAPAA